MFLLTEISPTVIFMLNTQKRTDDNQNLLQDNVNTRVTFKESIIT